MYSVHSNDYWYFFNGLAGALIFFLFACVMFYTGQWGGGDAKMVLGLGAVFGFPILMWRSVFVLSEMHLISIFFINVLIIGGFYGLFFSIFLAIKHWHKFKTKFIHYSKDKKIVRIKILVVIVCILLFIFSFSVTEFLFKVFLYLMMVFIVLSIYFYLFAKAVEEGAMQRDFKINELTEGEWIVNDVWIKKTDNQSLLNHFKENNKREVDYFLNNNFMIRLLDSYFFSKYVEKKKNKIIHKYTLTQDDVLDVVCKKFYYVSYTNLFRFLQFHLYFKWSDNYKKFRNVVKKLIHTDSEHEFSEYLSNLNDFVKFSKKDVKEMFVFDLDEKYVCGPKDLGIEKYQIDELKRLENLGKIEKVLVKVGIPFVPSFMISFLVTVLFGNWFILFL